MTDKQAALELRNMHVVEGEEGFMQGRISEAAWTQAIAALEQQTAGKAGFDPKDIGFTLDMDDETRAKIDAEVEARVAQAMGNKPKSNAYGEACERVRAGKHRPAIPEGMALVPIEKIALLSANIQVLVNVIEDPQGGNPLAKMIILETAKNTVKDADVMIAAAQKETK